MMELSLSIEQIIVAAGAIGTAAFAIVEGIKALGLNRFGFTTILKRTDPIKDALGVALGSGFENQLKTLYIGDKTSLINSIRQSLLIGLNPNNVSMIAKELGLRDLDILVRAVRDRSAGKELDAEAETILRRFELAMDIELETRLIRAKRKFAGLTRIIASAVSLLIPLIFLMVFQEEGGHTGSILAAGLIAVPMAPISTDLVSTLKKMKGAYASKTRTS